MPHHRAFIIGSLLSGAAALALTAIAALPSPPASAHEGHASFSAGEPGDPKQPARVVKISMLEDGKKMLFEPAVVQVRRGEQIRFVITNDGTWDHEFMLASKADNRKHAVQMKKFPIWSTTIRTPNGWRRSTAVNWSGGSPRRASSNTPA